MLWFVYKDKRENWYLIMGSFIIVKLCLLVSPSYKILSSDMSTKKPIVKLSFRFFSIVRVIKVCFKLFTLFNLRIKIK